MNHQFLFPDSHILLHYKFFTDIDWCKIVGGDIVELVIPCTVISTLDKKKYDSSDSAVRERARKVTVRLLNHEDGSPIRERVTVSLLDHEPEIDFAQRGLSRESEDDRIIAEILIYREAYPDRQITVITNDAGMTLKCKRRSIPILEIPEDCRLPDRLDAQAKRIKELQTRVAELESMLPELRLSFSHGEDWIELKLNSAKLLSEEEIEKRIKATKEQLKAPLNEWKLSEKIRPAYQLAAVANMFAPTADDWQRYSDEIEEYLLNFENYLKEESAFAEYLARRIKLTFTLVNNGNAPAEDIDVFIHFDCNFEVVLEERLRARPAAPQKPLPPRPRKFGLAHFQDLNSLYQIPTLPNIDFRPSNVSDFKVRKTNSEEVSGHVGRIKQGTEIELVDVYVIFPSIAEAKPFTIDYMLNSASLPTYVTGDLHVKIQPD